MKQLAPDITGLNVTKLPPGKAFGADGLSRWSLGNRTKTQMRTRKTSRRRRPFKSSQTSGDAK
jgi:hypothetical protein